jgi:branched-subunit amino acid transport protein
VNAWFAVLLGSVAVFSWKYLGYLLPSRFLESKTLTAVSGFLTIGLLAGLVGVQTFVSRQQLEFDARVPAILVAVLLLKLRAPFIVIVIAAGATAALLRLVF